MSLHASAVEMLTDWQAPDPAQDTLRHAVLAFLAVFLGVAIQKEHVVR